MAKTKSNGAMTLVEKAKAVPLRNKTAGTPTNDRIDLAIAVLADEVSWQQAAAALGLKRGKNGGGYGPSGQYLFPAIREAFRRGMLVRK